MGIRRTFGPQAAAAAVVAGVLLVLAGPAAAAPYPQKNAPPVLQGPATAQDGLTYTVKPGVWYVPGQTPHLSYQWLRCNSVGTGCQAIAGATAKSYKLTTADVGGQVRARETAACAVTTPVCSPAAADTASTSRVLRDPTNETDPEISGTARAGQLLSASAGFWRSPSPLRFAYQWIRCDAAGTTCSNLPGAVGPQYRLGAAQVGARLRVVVTASNSRPRSGTAVSAPTPAVGRALAKKAPRRRGLRLLSPFPRIVIAGVVSRGAVRLTEFTVRGPRGAIVRARCRGRGCPLRSRRLVLRSRRVRVRALQRRWRPGLVLEVTVSKRGFIGKFSRFRFRSGTVPRRQDRCLAFGARKPRRCPRGTR